MADLQAKCNECDESCDVAPNNWGHRKGRYLTEKKTVFDFLSENQFWEACGQFFLAGELPKGLESLPLSDYFICQTYEMVPYFATKFNKDRKTAYFSAYKPNIGDLGRPDWRNLYEHGTYTGYLIYTYFSSHIHSDWAF